MKKMLFTVGEDIKTSLKKHKKMLGEGEAGE